MVQIDQDTAQESIGQLSDLLRYTLYESNHELVPVEGEIEFMNPKPDVNRSGSGIGLENLRRRLDLAYPSRYQYDQALRENSYFVQITLRDCL